MNLLQNDRWFLVLAIVVLVTALAVAAAAASDDEERGTAADWRPPVPDVHDADPPDEPGVATIDGTDATYDSVQAAIDDAESGDVIVLEGVFEEHVTIDTPGVTLEASEPEAAVIDGGGDGTVVTITAEDVTLDGLWIRESGHDRATEDAGVLVNGNGTTLSELRLSEITFGVWIGEAESVTVEGATIVGREDVGESLRGNGIHLDRADDAELRDNHITVVRDGIYYSWSDGVVSEGNVMWDLRYGVHYMFSADNRLEGNAAFDNDVGFALMISSNLTIANNTAVANDGPSGQGILVKEVDDSEIRDNAVVANGNGFYVYNAHRNEILDNAIVENGVGIHITAGSSDELVAGNSFIDNGVSAYAASNAQVDWNDTDGGNYWSDARAVDLDGDGTSEIRHQPAGTAERLVHERPQTAAFAESPAFDAVRLAESSFPIVDAEGVVDHRPLSAPAHQPTATAGDVGAEDVHENESATTETRTGESSNDGNANG